MLDQMDERGLRGGQLVALSGALALLGSLFAPWYRLEFPGELRRALLTTGQGLPEPFRSAVGSAVSRAPDHFDFSAWRALTATDAALCCIAILAIALTLVLAGGFAGAIRADADAGGRVTSALGLLAVVIVLARMVDQPGPNALLSVRWGAWLALLGAFAITLGGWWASRRFAKPAPLPATPLPDPRARVSVPPPG